jgi:hypothetical protein
MFPSFRIINAYIQFLGPLKLDTAYGLRRSKSGPANDVNEICY